ncbi:uncharacterized protein LOC131860144 [Cryptomeria japonica]|uniref:uncharacterized protein LOC131860144 n=1 Tax=Cryptomeria japonica TaxID=3369 RepID=UPI0027DA0F93|nr:uncharacterized protein LOC131860144 [Cryptomeria japonica]
MAQHIVGNNNNNNNNNNNGGNSDGNNGHGDGSVNNRAANQRTMVGIANSRPLMHNIPPRNNLQAENEPTHSFTAAQVADLFFCEVFRLHGLPKNITNGQTEIVNKWLEGYLRNYVSKQQKAWDILKALKDNFQIAQNQQKLYSDQKRIERLFEVGDMVYLRLQPFRQSTLKKSGAEKLKPRFYGPFKVIRRVGIVAYELELPTSSRVHNVFHVSRLKKALGHNVIISSDLSPLDEEGELALVLEAILDVRERFLRRTIRE